jgi:hypothetical protein
VDDEDDDEAVNVSVVEGVDDVVVDTDEGEVEVEVEVEVVAT